MASVASYVYTRLGVEALEDWTNLTREMKTLHEKLQETPSDEVDRILQEIHSLGIRISQIEKAASVPPDLPR